MLDIARGDAALAWLCALGMAHYIAYIHRQRTRSLLERRMLMLLYCLEVFFIARGLTRMAPGRWVSVATLAPAILLPLAATLFVEGMLRRHMSLAFKLFVAFGSATFSVWNLLPSGRTNTFFRPFTAYLILGLGGLALVLVRRDRRSLSPLENRYADATSVAFLVATAFTATELDVRPSWLPYGLGGLGGLTFLHVCVHLTESRVRRLRIAWDIVRQLVEAAGIAAAYSLVVRGTDRATLLFVFLLASSCVFTFSIRWRLRSLSRRRHDVSLRRWLVNTQVRTLDEFIDALRHAPWGAEPIFLRDDSLADYDEALIGGFLASNSGTATLARLRDRMRTGTEDIRAAEQLIDLLENHDMTHVALLGEQPVTLLLVNLPDVAGADATAGEIALVQKIARLLPAEEPVHA